MHWLILALGGIFVLIGFIKINVVYVGIGCFLGIAARIVQAEVSDVESSRRNERSSGTIEN
jgi:hypothetical protein